jgi:hypothetical protein
MADADLNRGKSTAGWLWWLVCLNRKVLLVVADKPSE